MLYKIINVKYLLLLKVKKTKINCNFFTKNSHTLPFSKCIYNESSSPSISPNQWISRNPFTVIPF